MGCNDIVDSSLYDVGVLFEFFWAGLVETGGIRVSACILCNEGTFSSAEGGVLVSVHSVCLYEHGHHPVKFRDMALTTNSTNLNHLTSGRF
jgi:hypothetical protein